MPSSAQEAASDILASPVEVVEDVKMAVYSVTVPNSFCCPILQEIMADPVQTCDRYVYERVAIEEWFNRGNRKSPMTGLPLRNV